MRKFAAFLTIAVLLLGVFLSVSAAEIPDPDRKGTLTLIMEWDGKPLNSGCLTLYRVGEIAEEDGNAIFVPVSELYGTDISLQDLKDKGLPQKLADLSVGKKLEPIRVPVREGEAKVSSLQAGLYMVTQSPEDACDGFEPIDPFLISLPEWDGETYRYDRKARPKVALQEEAVTEPTETEPTEPPETVLPQTGQWNWPVPVLAVSGLLLILVGWTLCAGKKAGNAE